MWCVCVLAGWNTVLNGWDAISRLLSASLPHLTYNTVPLNTLILEWVSFIQHYAPRGLATSHAHTQHHIPILPITAWGSFRLNVCSCIHCKVGGCGYALSAYPNTCTTSLPPVLVSNLSDCREGDEEQTEWVPVLRRWRVPKTPPQAPPPPWAPTPNKSIDENTLQRMRRKNEIKTLVAKPTTKGTGGENGTSPPLNRDPATAMATCAVPAVEGNMARGSRRWSWYITYGRPLTGFVGGAEECVQCLSSCRDVCTTVDVLRIPFNFILYIQK